MKHIVRVSLVVILCAVYGVGCSSIDPKKYPLTSKSAVNPRHPQWHTVHIPQVTNVTVRAIDKFNPIWWFGNADDPVPPEWYRPQKASRRCTWLFVRNPLHNFMFYVVGVADKDVARSGYYPERVFNPYGGWNNCVCKMGRVRLPIITYQRNRFYFYCGWRSRGHFGIKCTFDKPPPPSAP